MRFHSKLEVDLSVLQENFQLLRSLAPSNETIFMIKANGYGHGLLEMAQYSHFELGVGAFGVASLGEAIKIRTELPSLEADIYVFSDTGLYDAELRRLYLDYNVVPVIGCFEDLKDFLLDKEFSHVPLILKIDTGMNRLGLGTEELEDAAALLKDFGRRSVHHLMTHFSSSFLKSKPGDRTQKQYENFRQAKSLLQSFGIAVEKTSCSNSGAIEQGIGLEESHIRPGLMLYGPGSLGAWKGKNISSLKTRVINSFMIKKGAPVGYGGHVCHKDGLLVYLPLGYGDGFLTYYSKLDINVEGRSARVLGRVNMVLCALLFERDCAEMF
ncbi:MAG: alanine racemase [Bacteriovoracaceae bacterium]